MVALESISDLRPCGCRPASRSTTPAGRVGEGGGCACRPSPIRRTGRVPM